MYTRTVLTGIIHFIGVTLTLKALYYISPLCLSYYYSFASHFIMCILMARVTFRFTKAKVLCSRIQPENKAVFITGCDSGFGNGLAKQLDSKGFHVFASCLFPEGSGARDLEKSCSKRLKILQLDVTMEQSVKAAVQYINSHLGKCELWSVVNNAGVLRGFSTELTAMGDFMETMNVNAFGAVRVTKAFLPLLRKSKGRVVNVASLAGRSPMPHFAPYTMSKYATVGFSDCLRQELLVWGVKVISVEPECFQTEMSKKENVASVIDSAVTSMKENIRCDYGEKYLKVFKKYFCEGSRIHASPQISKVLDAIEKAVSLEYPDIVYQPCRNILLEELVSFYLVLPKIVQDLMHIVFFYITKSPIPDATRKKH